MLWALFSSYFLRNEKKEYSTPQTSFLMLEANKANALARLDSSSIKFSKEGKGSLSFFNFKLKEIIELRALVSSKWHYCSRLLLLEIGILWPWEGPKPFEYVVTKSTKKYIQ